MSTTLFKRTLTFTFTLRATISTSTHPTSPQPPSSTVSTAVQILTHHRSKSRCSTLHSLFPHGFTPPQISQILLKICNNPRLALRFFTFTTQNSTPCIQSYATVVHILARARLKARAKSLIKLAVEKFECDPEVGSEKSSMFTALQLSLVNRETISEKRCKLFRESAIEKLECDLGSEKSKMSAVSLDNRETVFERCNEERFKPFREPAIEKFECDHEVESEKSRMFATLPLLLDYRETVIERCDKESRESAIQKSECDPEVGSSKMSAALSLPLSLDDRETVCNKGKCKLFRALVETYRVCNSAPFVFDLLIKSYLEMNKLDPCFDIIELLKSRGIYLHVSTYNALISTALRLKGCFFGYELYKEIFSCNGDGNERVKEGGKCKLVPNVHTFNELMASFRRNGVVDMVEKIWIEMVRLKCEPDVCSFCILMAAYCDDGDMEKAERVWEELRVKGLEADSVCYNTLIGGYCKVGEVEKGEVLYREMELRGLEGDCVTYGHLIHGYCLAGKVDGAMLVFNVMCRKGFKADGGMVDLLVRILCCKRSVLEGLEFFRSVMENADFVAQESTFQVLIKGLCREGKMQEALKFQARMAGKGFRPNSVVYDAFIDGYIKLGNLELAENLRKEMRVRS